MTNLRTQEAWRDLHQPFELNWWREHLPHGQCADPGFTMFWDDIKAFIEPHGWVIDIGCGPRPPFIPCDAIEPLAREYIQITPREWWDDVAWHARPAEDLIPFLRGDTIVCANCLDHTVGWKQILDNIVKYANSGARIMISTDFHEPFLGHPGYPRAEFEAEINKRFHILKSREQRPGTYDRALTLLMAVRVL